jgi:hypothetical protein
MVANLRAIRKIKWLRAIHHCAESIFKVEYQLREYESIFETALAHESVDPGVLFDEKKNQRSKISCYCPF